MACLPGVGDNHTDQLRHLNLAQLTLGCTSHVSVRTIIISRVAQAVHNTIEASGLPGCG